MANDLIRSFLIVAVVGCVGDTAEASAPKDLEACYMNIALTKANADMAYVAREMCDDLFKPKPQSLYVLPTKERRCDVWWFDARGQYQSPERLCLLKRRDNNQWSFACETLANGVQPYVAILKETSGAFEPTQAKGEAPGLLFPSMEACITHRLSK